MSEFFILIILFVLFGFLSTSLAYIALNSFRKQDYLISLFSTLVFLICLIGLSYLLIQLMIEDTIILQVDTTIIAGLLILLSIASIWGKNQTDIIKHKLVKNTGLYYSPRQVFFLVIPFSISAIATLANFVEPDFMRYLSVGMCIIGFILIIIIGIVISSKDGIVKTSAKDPTLDTKNDFREDP